MRRIDLRRAVMLGLIPVVMVTAACTSPAPTRTPQPGPTPTVTATPLSHEFVSKLYGFRLTLPKDWSGADATQNWDGEQLQGVDSSYFADFAESGIDRQFAIGAAPVGTGTTLAAWRAAVVRASGCPDARTVQKATLGGEPALTWRATCSDVHPVKFVVLHGARGYVGIFLPLGSSMNAADLGIYDAIRQSFHFTR